MSGVDGTRSILCAIVSRHQGSLLTSSRSRLRNIVMENRILDASPTELKCHNTLCFVFLINGPEQPDTEEMYQR
jgi:hypothetical protein